jgi:TatD DNase family protein
MIKDGNVSRYTLYSSKTGRINNLILVAARLLMKLIDTHCHLYLKEFEHDLHEVMQRAKNAGIEKVCFPAIDREVIDDMLRIEKLYPEEVFLMMGLHPGSVKGNYKEELKVVEEYLGKRKFVAVGEIGLDFYWDTSYMKEQFDVFNRQMELALSYNLPIVIHTRNAMKETIDAVRPFAEKGLRGIFHCFGDSNGTAKQIINMGFYLGIGGVLTYKKANLAEALKDIDLNHIVLETDAPYLSPVPYRGKRNESSYLVKVAKKLAEIKDVPLEEVARITTSNAEKIFN